MPESQEWEAFRHTGKKKENLNTHHQVTESDRNSSLVFPTGFTVIDRDKADVSSQTSHISTLVSKLRFRLPGVTVPITSVNAYKKLCTLRVHSLMCVEISIQHETITTIYAYILHLHTSPPAFFISILGENNTPHKISPLSTFSVYNTVLSTTGTVLYSTPLGLEIL